jgi:hypothetical protein
MGQVFQKGEAVPNNLVGSVAVQAAYHADAAGVVLEPGVVEALGSGRSGRSGWAGWDWHGTGNLSMGNRMILQRINQSTVTCNAESSVPCAAPPRSDTTAKRFLLNYELLIAIARS